MRRQARVKGIGPRTQTLSEETGLLDACAPQTIRPRDHAVDSRAGKTLLDRNRKRETSRSGWMKLAAVQGALALALIGCPGGVSAQAFPERPIHLIGQSGSAHGG